MNNDLKANSSNFLKPSYYVVDADGGKSHLASYPYGFISNFIFMAAKSIK